MGFKSVMFHGEKTIETMGDYWDYKGLWGPLSEGDENEKKLIFNK